MNHNSKHFTEPNDSNGQENMIPPMTLERAFIASLSATRPSAQLNTTPGVPKQPARIRCESKLNHLKKPATATPADSMINSARRTMKLLDIINSALSLTAENDVLDHEGEEVSVAVARRTQRPSGVQVSALSHYAIGLDEGFEPLDEEASEQSKHLRTTQHAGGPARKQ